jgi:excinuclease ABC subunit C
VRFKVCLEYHIGTAKGLEGFESLENYQKQVDAIREILKKISRKV